MRSEGTPIYQQLLNDLKKSIDEGKYKTGDLLPSENDLCRTYSTTRPTVRQALSALKAMGYIHKHHGKGSMVTESKKGLGILSVIGVTAGVGNKDLKTEIIRAPVKADWPADFFYELNDTETAAGSIVFSRLRRLHDVPTLFEETYITDFDLPRFTARSLENRSLFKTLKDHYGVEIKDGEQSIWAISADKTISNILQVKTGSPVLHIKRKLNTNITDLHIYSWLYCNTADYHLQDYF